MHILEPGSPEQLNHPFPTGRSLRNAVSCSQRYLINNTYVRLGIIRRLIGKQTEAGVTSLLVAMNKTLQGLGRHVHYLLENCVSVTERTPALM